MSGATTAATEGGWSYRPAVTRVSGWLTAVLTLALLYWGWTHRDRFYINAEEGLGYTLGVVGGTLMLLLGFYPLRKHLRFMRDWGAVRHWFRMHMAFGIIGPLAILFHADFRTGATNSNMALYSMLIVSSSGLIGRYLYSKIHAGLYGRQLELRELREAWMQACTRLDLHAHHLDAIGSALEAFERPLQTMTGSVRNSLLRLPLAAWRRRRILHQGSRVLKRAEGVSAAERTETLQLLRQRLAGAAGVYRVAAFDRLFSLWHVLHLPLYLMLIVTGVIHVISVHMY